MILYFFLFMAAVVLVQPEECQDNTQQCSTWKHFCHDETNKDYLRYNCKLTCGYCKCADNLPTCLSRMGYCTDRANRDYMTKKCKQTCNLCTGRCGVAKIPSTRVINGVNAVRGAWPWQVAIKSENLTICGGTIIGPLWVVTAAHCLQNRNIDKITVTIGEYDLDVNEGSEMEMGVAKVINHEKFMANTYDYDISLLKLDRPIIFNSYSGMACLPSSDKAVSVGTECVMTGWGKVHSSLDIQPVLQQARLPIVDNGICTQLNTRNTGLKITNRMLCAGYGPSIPTAGCSGDSGGPLVCQTGSDGSWVLHGILSWGSTRCSTRDAYTVFTNASALIGWIDQQMTNGDR